MLKDERTKRGMTQEDLARLMDVERGSVANWETGLCRPSRKTRQRLCNVFRCTEEELFGEVKPPRRRAMTCAGVEHVDTK